MANGLRTRFAILATVARLQPVAACTAEYSSSQHGADIAVALRVLGTATIPAFYLGSLLALELPATTILAILARDRGEHVESVLDRPMPKPVPMALVPCPAFSSA